MVVSIRKMALWVMIKSLLLSVFIRILFPEVEGRMFIRNVDNHQPGYAVFAIYRYCIPFPIGNVCMCILYTQMRTGLSRSKDFNR